MGLNHKIMVEVGLTIGRIEVGNTKLVFWDFGGQPGLRSIWEKYYEESHAVIYVLDANAPSRFEDSNSALDALLGIRELLLKFPAELKSHKNVVIEKLPERISDDDKVVRETLYQLFKSIILPGCKEDIKGAPISLIMAYIFKEMMHLAIGVRFMAFKFFDLVVQNYPPAFFTYAEKVVSDDCLVII
ncbi:hypothetical protein BVRB_2g038970 [Beta vulgaris subsp. vulgaris]|nr:hypothetical protein BVRB_2g038970 [Beta vulgaris subsp. vulgaris]